MGFWSKTGLFCHSSLYYSGKEVNRLKNPEKYARVTDAGRLSKTGGPAQG